jgi:sugar lactone lactonase YvrE
MRRPKTVDHADGLPDGLAVDADGCVWVCLFGGGAVRRYAPDGSLEAHLPLPVTCPTCPAFGGADLATLYITTARHRLSPGQLTAEPLAGALLACRPGARGQPGHAFAG